jgi:hypothetical protein
MAFTNNSFSGPSCANSACPRIFTYRTNDTEAVVEGSGYFNDKVNELAVGDMIFIHADADGTQSFEMTYVTANDGTDVTIQGLSQVTASA